VKVEARQRVWSLWLAVADRSIQTARLSRRALPMVDVITGSATPATVLLSNGFTAAHYYRPVPLPLPKPRLITHPPLRLTPHPSPAAASPRCS
jgi:hypothetical protein